MANKEIKIAVPEGYEIDRENSTFECIKFKKKALIYEDIEVHIAKQKARGLFSAVIEEASAHGNVVGYTTLGKGYCYPEHLRRLMAFNKLLNVAKYLNEKTLDWDNRSEKKWLIGCVHPHKKLIVESYYIIQGSGVYFDSKEHAEQAIQILGEDEVKRALGVF